MSILKFENKTPKSLDEMCRYMADSDKTDNIGIFGIGINPLAPAEEMQFVQELYARDDIAHPYLQVIFSFDVNVEKSKSELQTICMQIAQSLIYDERQLFGTIHFRGTNNIHCHYIINYVGIDGSLYRQKYHISHYLKLVSKILQEYGLNPIKNFEIID